MSVMDNIRLRQPLSVLPARKAPPKHEPEMLYIGCVDARLDPIDDIGIDKGTALIFRNIGALVLKDGRTGKEAQQNVGIGAVLEFFLNHLPIAPGKVKHIVVSGHTDCGGLQACQHEQCGEHDPHLSLYLESLKQVRDKVRALAAVNGWDDIRILQEMERESVRQSMKNLHSYAVVERALKEGRVELHGWVIDTATQRIAEMNLRTQEFEPMTGERY